MENFTIIFFIFVLGIATSECKCQIKRNCKNDSSSLLHSPGDIYFNNNCQKCTCRERHQKVMTCYRPLGSRYEQSHTGTYYFAISPAEAKGLKCPVGMFKSGKESVNGDLFIHYIKIDTVSKCCDIKYKIPSTVPSYCKSVLLKDKCEYKLVLKSNQKIKCPV